MVLAAVGALLAAPLARAQDPVRMCADAAAGAEIEVCVRLAADHPEAAEGVSAALRAHADRQRVGERELLVGLLLLLDPPTSERGAALLGALDDPRAIPALSAALLHQPEPTKAAAAAALARQTAGFDALRGIALDPSLPAATRAAATRGLAAHPSPEATLALAELARERRLPPEVRAAADDALAARAPELLAAIGPVGDGRGTPWIVGGSAWTGALALGLTGAMGPTDLAGPGAAAGLASGAAGGWLLARARPSDAPPAALVSSSGLAASAGGAALARRFGPEHPASPWAGAVAGQGVGAGLAAVASAEWPGTSADAVEGATVGGLTGLAVGGAVRALTHHEDDPERGLGAAGGAILAGTLVGQVAAPRVMIDGADPWMIGLAAAYGGAFGAWLPVDTRERPLLSASGAAIGALSGYALAAPLKARNDVVFGAALGMAYGGASGWASARLVAPDREDLARIGLIAGASAGLGGGALLAWRDLQAMDSPDTALVAAVSVWAAAQATVAVGGRDPDPRTQAKAVLVPAVIGGATAVATSWVEVPEPYTFAALSLGATGGWIGGGVGELAGGSPRVGALIGSNAGLITGVVLAAPPVSAPPLVIGLGDAGAVLGGALGALGVAWFTEDADPVLAGALVGTGAGFAGGAWVGSRLHRSGATRELARLGVPRLPGDWSLGPHVGVGAAGPAWGLAVEGRRW